MVPSLVRAATTRFSQRSKKDSGETSFLESRLQPDSFFGASGGQRIDTRDAPSSSNSSSMSYSLSQLDADVSRAVVFADASVADDGAIPDAARAAHGAL